MEQCRYCRRSFARVSQHTPFCRDKAEAEHRQKVDKAVKSAQTMATMAERIKSLKRENEILLGLKRESAPSAVYYINNVYNVNNISNIFAGVPQDKHMACRKIIEHLDALKQADESAVLAIADGVADREIMEMLSQASSDLATEVRSRMTDEKETAVKVLEDIYEEQNGVAND